MSLPNQGRGGGIPLKAAPLAAAAGQALGVSDHVAELAGAEMRAGVKPAIQHRRAADAGAEAYA